MTPTDKQSSCRILGNIGDNHNGNSQLAHQLVEIAASAGCDGVVLPHRRVENCYTKEGLVQPIADGTHGYRTRGEMLQALELPAKALEHLREICRGRMEFIGAPYDLEAFSDLRDLNPDGYQVDPPVLGHLPLLEAIASTGKPVFLVAGMCTEEDLDAALEITGRETVTILHCVYAQGVPLESTGLWGIPWLREKFETPVGYLGLEEGTSAAVAALAMGAWTIEKVFTSDKFLPGPAHASSIDRDELRRLVNDLRSIEKAINGTPPRIIMAEELTGLDGYRASLVATRDLVAGTSLEESMLSVKLSSNGVGPRLLGQVIGRRLAYDVMADAPLTFGVLEA